MRWLFLGAFLAGIGYALHTLLPPQPRWSLTTEGYVVLGLAVGDSKLCTARISREEPEVSIHRACIEVRDLETGAVERTLWPDAPVRDAYVFSEDGRYLTVLVHKPGEAKQELRWADLQTGRDGRAELERSPRHGPWMLSLAPGGRLMALYDEPTDLRPTAPKSSRDQTLLLYQTDELRRLARINLPGRFDERADSWCWASDGSALLTCRLSSRPADEPQVGLALGRMVDYRRPLSYRLSRFSRHGEDSRLLQIAGYRHTLMPEGEVLIAEGFAHHDDGDGFYWLEVLDLATGNRRLKAELGLVCNSEGEAIYTVSPGGRWLMVRTTDAQQKEVIGLWELASGKQLGQIPCRGDSFFFTKDGRALLQTSKPTTDSGYLAIYDLPFCRQRWVREWPQRCLSRLLISVDTHQVSLSPVQTKMSGLDWNSSTGPLARHVFPEVR
jgi:hypothetical protein